MCLVRGSRRGCWQVTPLPAAAEAPADGAGEAQQEVIEFAWIAIDVSNKSIVDSKTVLIKPEGSINLGDRCKEITGLGEAELSSGTTLQACIKDFNNFLYTKVTEENKDFCLVTDGDSCLKLWLRSDAKLKKVKLAAHYSKFIDMRAEFRQKYPNWAGADSCTAMADRLGVEIEAGVGGGMRMCRALAAVMLRLLEDGAPFVKTVTIPDDYDPLTDPQFKGGANGAAQPAAMGSDNTILKCRGLPFSAQKSDVEAFFRGCNIVEDGIWIVVNQFQRATGDAFVTFATPEDAKRAAGRHRDMMQQRYVEVFSSTQADMDAVRASLTGSSSAGNSSSNGTTNTNTNATSTTTKY
jgi:inhibitor of KinA sporulation pathway (predicted exonuclease)